MPNIRSSNSQTEGLQRLASDTFVLSGDVHRLITFLNQSLKDKGFIFGLTKAGEEYGVSIYVTREYNANTR